MYIQEMKKAYMFQKKIMGGKIVKQSKVFENIKFFILTVIVAIIIAALMSYGREHSPVFFRVRIIFIIWISDCIRIY